MVYDAVIVGLGVCGTAVAMELSKYRGLRVLCLEKDTDVANATSKANSGIVHAGYDPEPGTLMAKYNAEGNRMIHQLAKELDVPFRNNGSLVVAFTEEEMETVQKLYERGIENGIPGLSVISAEEVRELEPNLNEEIKGALYAKSAGVISPWELAVAEIDIAVQNGVEVRLETEVTGIVFQEDGFEIAVCSNGGQESITTRCIVNAAGVHAGEICSFVSKPPFRAIPNKGQYYLLDKSQGGLVERVIFQCPTKLGKGVLVSPTAHGNLIVGPDSNDVADGEDTSTTAHELNDIRRIAAKSCDKINYREAIRNFAGVRAQGDIDEFVVGPIPESKAFINIANIKSPGLTASPAIAKDVARMLGEAGLVLEEKEDYVKTRKVVRMRHLNLEQKQRKIQENPRYGRVICRCETVTEGEIVDAIHSPLPARTIDAVKRRCNAGMGRCQGGFCGPRVLELISRELDIPMEQVMQDKRNSYVLTGATPKGQETGEEDA